MNVSLFVSLFVCLFVRLSVLNEFKNHTSNHRDIIRCIPGKVFVEFFNPRVYHYGGHNTKMYL